jgi:hypothetical protein
MAPYLRMTSPNGLTNLASISFEPGVPMFRSWICLGTILPIDYSYVTLVSLSPGVGFVEESRMGSMRKWRHDRRITPLAAGCRIVDTLTFEPRFCSSIVAIVVKYVFLHRHRMLRKYLA